MKGRRLLAIPIGLSLAYSVVSSSELSADDVLFGEWPVVGQGYENLQQPEFTNISSANAADLIANVKWQFDSTDVPGASIVAGAPAVADGKVYFADGGGSIYAVDLQSGQPIWRNGPHIPNPPIAPAYSFLANDAFEDGPNFITTPVLTEDRLYIASSNGDEVQPFEAKMFCLNRHTGAIEWVRPISATVTHEGKTYQPNDYTGDPTVVDNLVIVGVASTETSGALNAPPIVDHIARGGVVAYDRFTGEERWRHFNTSDQSQPKPEFGGGAGSWSSPAIDLQRRRLYIGVGQSFEHLASPMSDSLIAIDYKNGILTWHIQMTANDVWAPSNTTFGSDWDVNTHPNLFTVDVEGEGEIDFVGVGDKRGQYYVIRRDQKKQNPRIEAILTLDRGTIDGAIQGTPTIDDVNDFLYISSEAIRADQGDGNPDDDPRVAIREAATLLGLSRLERQFVVSSKVVKVDLRALLSAPTRWQDSIVWEVRTDGTGQTFGPLTMANDVIVQPTGSGNLRFIAADDGTIVAQTGQGFFENGVVGILFGGTTIVGDILLVPTVNQLFNGGVTAFELP